MIMLFTVPSRLKSAVLGLFFTIALFYLWVRPPYVDIPGFSGSADPRVVFADVRGSQDRFISRVQNETLGFQQVYMISLPSRSDKRDAFALQATLSGIVYDQVDGVSGQDVPEKARPFVSRLVPRRRNIIRTADGQRARPWPRKLLRSAAGELT